VKSDTPPTPTPTNTPTLTWTPTITPGGPTFTPTPSPTPTPYLVRVNCGGTAYVDTQGQGWAADKAFVVGSWGYTAGSARSSTKAVNGTTDDPLYQKYRELAGEYKFTVPNGTYEVRLKWAEFGTTSPTGRIMKITLETTIVESSLSVYSVVGAYTALDRVYTVSVNDGVLNVVFAQNGGSKVPMISAIQVKGL
jgi:chitinase